MNPIGTDDNPFDGDGSPPWDCRAPIEFLPPARGVCRVCDRERTVYGARQDGHDFPPICGTCQDRRARSQNTRELWRGRLRRRGY
jgi:hypothetical protein